MDHPFCIEVKRLLIKACWQLSIYLVRLDWCDPFIEYKFLQPVLVTFIGIETLSDLPLLDPLTNDS